jgi:transposase-like protein
MTFPKQGNGDVGSVPAAGVPLGAEEAVRRLLERLVQEALEKEFERQIGAGRWERSPARQGWRNGSKPRKYRTRVGTLELQIPKDRDGRFQPSLFERYQRSEKALVLAITEMYLRGVSTRKVSGIVEQLCGFGISASQVSALTKKLDAELQAWRERPLGEFAMPFLLVDAHYEKVRIDGRVRNVALLWVVGVREDGYREHLGVWSARGEDDLTWGAVCQDLLKRGLRGVRFIVSDEHKGLRSALTRAFPGVAQQRCQVHYLRNLYSQCATPERFEAVRMALQEAWGSGSLALAQERIKALIDSLQEKSPKVASWLEESIEETLAVFELSTDAQRKRLRTTNSIEHGHAEVRRRTRVVRIFPNEESLVRLSTALAIERNEQWTRKRYLLVTDEQRIEYAWSRRRHAG